MVGMSHSIRYQRQNQIQFVISNRTIRQAQTHPEHLPPLPIILQLAQDLMITLDVVHLRFQKVRQLGHLLSLAILDHDHPRMSVLLCFFAVSLRRTSAGSAYRAMARIGTYYRACATFTSSSRPRFSFLLVIILRVAASRANLPTQLGVISLPLPDRLQHEPQAHRLESSFFLCARYSLTTPNAPSIPCTYPPSNLAANSSCAAATLHLVLPYLSNISPHLAPSPLSPPYAREACCKSSPWEIITSPRASPGRIFSFALCESVG